jgi:hypothetical protein
MAKTVMISLLSSIAQVGAIHEAAVLCWGSPSIKNRQDIAPT